MSHINDKYKIEVSIINYNQLKTSLWKCSLHNTFYDYKFVTFMKSIFAHLETHNDLHESKLVTNIPNKKHEFQNGFH